MLPLLQVLCAHLFGVSLLHEGETVLGIVGSAAIAAGVVTVNSAKFATAEPAGPKEGSRAGSLPSTLQCPPSQQTVTEMPSPAPVRAARQALAPGWTSWQLPLGTQGRLHCVTCPV